MEHSQIPVAGDDAFAVAGEAGEDSHLPEALLWRELRSRPSGLRFSRRRATGKYMHDFYCPDARLAIELGGTTSDQMREEWLARAGIATMRIPAKHILAESARAAREIISRARTLLPQDHPALAVPFLAKPTEEED